MNIKYRVVRTFDQLNWSVQHLRRRNGALQWEWMDAFDTFEAATSFVRECVRHDRIDAARDALAKQVQAATDPDLMEAALAVLTGHVGSDEAETLLSIAAPEFTSKLVAILTPAPELAEQAEGTNAVELPTTPALGITTTAVFPFPPAEAVTAIEEHLCQGR